MAKVKDLASAKKAQATAKEDLLDANKALTDFCKKNKLSRDGDHSKDKKFGKEYKELKLAAEKASTAMDDANEAVKSFKKEENKSAASGRTTKYEYPDGLTSEEKKQFRIQKRREAKGEAPKVKKEKAEKAPKGKKAEKTKSGGKPEKTTVITKKKGKKAGKSKSSKND